MKTPIIKQHDERDCGAACLSMIAESYGRKLSLPMCRQLIKADQNGANIYALTCGAKQIGLAAAAMQGSPDELKKALAERQIRTPFIAHIITDDHFEHYVVVYRVQNDRVTFVDPAKGKLTESEGVFFSRWTGHIVAFQKTESFQMGNDRKGSFRKFTNLIFHQKKLVLSVVLISFFISFVSLIGSLVFEYIVNHLVYQGKNTTGTSHILDLLFSNVDTLCVAVVMLYLFQGGVQILRSYLLAVMSRRIDISLTTNFYKHLIHLPIGFFGTRKSGEILSRFNDTSSIQQALSATALTLIIDSMMTIFFGFYLYRISNILFLISLSVMLGYTVIVILFKNPICKVNQDSMENDAQTVSYLKESIEGAETVKAFGIEENVLKKAFSLYYKGANLAVSGGMIDAVKNTLISLIASMGMIFLLWTGNCLCVSGKLALGSLVTFYLLLNYFLSPLQSLIELQPVIQTAMVAADRLNDILELPVEQENGENRDEQIRLSGDISIQDLTFRYGFRFPAIDHVSVSIPQGSRVAVVGESGSGKTTLMKLLLSFYQPECGTITIGGRNLKDLDGRSIRNRIAYVSQDTFFFADTVRNNLTIGNPSITDSQLDEICSQVSADTFIKELPMGYDTVLTENASNLSGGQRQRLSIARALLRKPDIIIMDEATSKLDAITEQSIKNTIFSMDKGVTIFIVAHQLRTIQNCDLILVMKKGKLIESGTHDTLLFANGQYKKFYDASC